MIYVLARDIVIPTGTKVDVRPSGTRSKIFCDFAEVLISETKDHTSEWTMPLDEALELGIIVQSEAEAA